MPPQEEAFRTDSAVLWAYNGVDEFNAPARGEPEEISVRWIPTDATANASAGGPDGSIQAVERIREAKVLVDRLIAPKSLLWLGTLAEWYGAGSGSLSDHEEVYEVKEYAPRKDLKGRVTRRQLRCLRFRGTLPSRSLVGTAARVNLRVVGSGFSNGSCTDCALLNVNTTAVLTVNMRRYQEWQSSTITGGGGSGLCAGNWRWTLKRYMDSNRIEAALSRVSGGTATDQSVWSREGTSWNGTSALVLNLEIGSSAACGWPSTLTIQGI